MFRNLSTPGTGFFLFLLALKPTISAPQTFVLDDPKGLNVVEFRSKAPLELIVGRTNAIGGTVTFDHQDLSQPFTASIKVDLRTLSTDNATRDQQMRENYLHTDQHPWAIFQASGKIITPSFRLMDGEAAEVKLKGNITINGVTKEIEVSGIARYFSPNPNLEKLGFPGDVLRFEGSFSVNLNDFNIERPQFLFLKLSDRPEISIAFTATTKWIPKEP